MKRFNTLILIVLLLSSCAPATTAVSTPTPQPTLTLTPSPTATQTPSPTPTITPTPTQIGGGTGKFIFEYYKIAYEKDFPDLKGEVNIFTSNWDGSNLTPITNGLDGINYVAGISPDGNIALVASSSTFFGKSALYLIHLDSGNSDPVKLTREVHGRPVFLDNARVVYIGKGSKGLGIYVSNFDGTEQTKIGSPADEFSTIVASDESRVYWKTSQNERFKDASGVLYMYGGAFQGLWWTNLDGSGQGKLESNGQQIISDQYAFSPDGKSIAWIPEGLEQGCSLLPSGFVAWTPFIRWGSETRNAQKPSSFFHENSPHFGKTIDIDYIEDYARQCFVLHVASLSDMDNDIKIPFIPPFDPNSEDFYYHKTYSLFWSPDSSKILAYDGGGATQFMSIIGFESYPLALYEIALKDTNPKLTLLKIISNSPMAQRGSNSRPYVSESFTSFKFSPDGRQLLFVKWNPYANFYSAEVKILNLETMDFVDDFTQKIIPDTQEKRVGEIFWLP